MLAACGGDDSDAAAGTPPAVKPDVKPPVTSIPATPIGPSTPVKPPVTSIPATPIGPSKPIKPPVTSIPATPIGPSTPVKPEIVPPTVILPIDPPPYIPPVVKPEIIFPIPKPEIVPPTVILPAPEQRKLIQELRFSDGATELKKENFGLDNWSPKALATKNDILYIGNDSETANILRYDLNSKAVLPTIQPEKMQGIGQSWNRLTDISIYHDRLYSASLSSNRVDIIDIASGEPKFIMALGTGSWAGDQENFAIVHPLSVAANDQYVFVADTQNRINVWKQSDIVSSNTLKAKKHARLSLPNCGTIDCAVRLETVGDLLYASFNNGQVYIYDVSTIQQGATGNTITPLKQTNPGINIFNTADDGLFYASRNSGHVESFDQKELKNDQNFLPQALESFRGYRLEGSSDNANLGKATDMVVNKEKVFQLSNGKVTILPLQRIQQYQSNRTGTIPELQQAAALSQTFMLQDGEDWDTLTNRNLRSFKIDRILSGTVADNTILVESYSAAAVNNLDIQARLKGSGQWFTLAHLDNLQPFSQTQLNLTISDQNYFPLVDGTGAIQLEGLKNFKQLPADLFDIKVTSKTDSLVQKLANIKPKWGIYFGKYDQSWGDWQKINPVYAREWVIMMTNFAYILSSPEFEHVWFNHKKVMGHDFFGNAGQIVGPGGYYTDQDYVRVFSEIMNRGDIGLGITTIGGGLGGGEALGIDTWYFYEHYFNADIGVIGHEFGHHWGSHNSAWSNYSLGLQSTNLQLHQYFQRKQQLPYMDPELNKFHKAPSNQLYNGIVENKRQPRPNSNVNNLERYFAQNPL